MAYGLAGTVVGGVLGSAFGIPGVLIGSAVGGGCLGNATYTAISGGSWWEGCQEGAEYASGAAVGGLILNAIYG